MKSCNEKGFFFNEFLDYVQVINTVIEKDVLQATKEESEASRALRSERIRLLKEKVEGEGGQLDVGDSGRKSVLQRN